VQEQHGVVQRPCGDRGIDTGNRRVGSVATAMEVHTPAEPLASVNRKQIEQTYRLHRPFSRHVDA
jgi:hypothetical protein